MAAAAARSVEVGGGSHSNSGSEVFSRSEGGCDSGDSGVEVYRHASKDLYMLTH